jgi:hypothetical protein
VATGLSGLTDLIPVGLLQRHGLEGHPRLAAHGRREGPVLLPRALVQVRQLVLQPDLQVERPRLAALRPVGANSMNVVRAGIRVEAESGADSPASGAGPGRRTSPLRPTAAQPPGGAERVRLCMACMVDDHSDGTYILSEGVDHRQHPPLLPTLASPPSCQRPKGFGLVHKQSHVPQVSWKAS